MPCRLMYVHVYSTGESVCEKLFAMGVKLITSTTEAEMRLCTSLVDERFGETTEIIEPWSAEVGCRCRSHRAKGGRYLGRRK